MVQSRIARPYGPAPAPVTTPGHDQPGQALDRAARAAAARLSGGVSSHAFVQSWTDWVLHLSQARGRQIELMARAGHNSGIVKAPGAGRGRFHLSYRAAGALSAGPDGWMAGGALAREGSWWPARADWRARHLCLSDLSATAPRP